MDTDPLLSVAQVAEVLSLNEQTVRNMIDRGDLAAFHIGRRVRIRRSDLDEFCARLPVEPKVVPAEPQPAPSPGEIAARARLADTARTVARAAKGKGNGPLVAALIELSEAARVLASELPHPS